MLQLIKVEKCSGSVGSVFNVLLGAHYWDLRVRDSENGDNQTTTLIHGLYHAVGIPYLSHLTLPYPVMY